MSIKKYLSEMLNEKKVAKKRTGMDRKKLRIKNDALMKATEGQYKTWSLKQKAQYISKWKYEELPGFKGRYVKRSPPLPVATVFMKMKKASKLLKKKSNIRKKGLAKKKTTGA